MIVAKDKTSYVCSDCGGSSAKWQGQCPQCQAWNTLAEQMVQSGPTVERGRFQSLAADGSIRKLADVDSTDQPRTPTGIEEFDRVLGGGLVAGGVVLVGGDPGIGKSTLLLQAMARLSENHNVLYVSGEESAQQIALRSKRLEDSADLVDVLPEIDLNKILGHLDRNQPQVVVIDSIQTLYTDEMTSAPGSVAQVRECAAQLTRYAKRTATAILLVGHVTKEGAIAGPRVLEHIVDTVIMFEGDAFSQHRLLRAMKNRYGSVNELGVFAMTEKGLKGVSNPSALFMSHHSSPVAGSAVTVTQEGSRPLLVEVQALVDSSNAPQPRRLAVGIEPARLAMLLAVVHRHCGVTMSDQDVFINAVGGVKIGEPSADLAVLLAAVSSLKNKPLSEKMVVFGEVGLAGEVRPVQRGQERLKEAARLGFTHAIIPKANQPKHAIQGMRVTAIERLEQGLSAAFP